MTAQEWQDYRARNYRRRELADYLRCWNWARIHALLLEENSDAPRSQVKGSFC